MLFKNNLYLIHTMSYLGKSVFAKSAPIIPILNYNKFLMFRKTLHQ